jgi:glycosyltransferase involved in cell wall biosynthesis
MHVNDIQGRTILCFASGYDAPPTSKHHVMHLLARNNRVLWVNYHASRRPGIARGEMAYLFSRLRKVFSGARQVRENLRVLTPLVLPLPGSRVARRINRLLLVRQVRRAMEGLDGGPLQIWSFCPDIAYLLDEFRAEKVVYYCVDDFAHFSGYDSLQVARDEQALCRRADLVITTSGALQQAKAALNPNTVLVPHGVDHDHFAAALNEPLPEPADLAAIPHPRIGFFGLIRDWVDLDLVAAVARRRPEWNFIFLGDSTVDLGPYRQVAGMHFLGNRPYQQLPAYCRGLDAAIIPFKLNELTRAVNPIKLREYLSAGLPVVSTPLPEVQRYGEWVELAEDPEGFARALERVMRQTPAQRRSASSAMRQETWQAKLEQISRHLAAARQGASREMKSEVVS